VLFCVIVYVITHGGGYIGLTRSIESAKKAAVLGLKRVLFCPKALGIGPTYVYLSVADKAVQFDSLTI